MSVALQGLGSTSEKRFENASLSPSRASRDPVHHLRSLFQEESDALDHTIHTHLEQRVPLIGTIANHLIRAGGKRLRSLLAMASCTLFDQKPTQKMIELAASVEFIHNATLLHDDVVDESLLRRGTPTANTLWGNKASILVGDFLFAKAFELMLGENEAHVLPILAKVCQTITEGEVLQLSYLHTFDITKDILFKIMESKTAALFAASCSIGAALYRRSDSEQKALYHFGHCLGLAFQIVDDVLDYMGTTETLGKAVGDDLREGKVTLPLLWLYDVLPSSDRHIMNTIVKRQSSHEGDFETVVEWMNTYNIPSMCLKEAEQFCHQAKTSLDIFPATATKEVFLHLVDSLLQRGT